MASAELRQIRRRIRSVQSTMKITRAMELIAASRIVRAQQRVMRSKPYVAKLAEVIDSLGGAASARGHLLLATHPLRTIGVVVVGSDRGLAGSYTTNVIRMAEHRVAELARTGVEFRLYLVGKKAQTYFRYRGYPIERVFLGVTDTPGYGDARAISATVVADYVGERVDAVEIFTTRFVSALTQTATRIELLPVRASAPTSGVVAGYSYEPAPEEILGRLLPRYMEATVFGALLEASASEHAARRRAMKAATENAQDLVRVLSRVANQARQAEITTEISEIVGGAEALTVG